MESTIQIFICDSTIKNNASDQWSTHKIMTIRGYYDSYFNQYDNSTSS